MGYYISKVDKEFLAPILMAMEKARESLSFTSPNPKRLGYLIRNAIGADPSLRHLKDKFRIKIKETRVVLEAHTLSYALDEKLKVLFNPSFMEIMTELFQGKDVELNEVDLNDDELKKIDTYAKANDYKIEITPTKIRITKNV